MTVDKFTIDGNKITIDQVHPTSVKQVKRIKKI
jgi:hypothetical protein